MSRIDIGQNIRKPRVVAATAEGFYKAVDDKQTGQICAELEDALEQKRKGALKDEEYKTLKAEKKKGCKFYTPHAHFNKGYKRSDGEPVDSGKAVIDLDGCEHFAQLYEQHLKGRERALGINMVNISVSKTGGHVLFDIPEGLTRQQAQAWMAHELGDVAYDPAVHELERAIFIPCSEYILYIDEELMFGDELHPATLSDEELQRWKAVVDSKRQQSGNGKTTPNVLEAGNDKTAPYGVIAGKDPRSPKREGETEGSPEEREIADQVRDEGTRENEDVSVGVSTGSTTLFSKPDERTRFIAKGVMQEKGLMAKDFLNEGGRHTTVKIFLSGATQLLTKAETNGVLSELMPEHWNDENIQQLVEDFYKNYTNPNQRLYKYQEQLFTQSQRLFGEESQAAQGIAGQARNEGSGMDNTNGTKNGIAPQALIAGKDPRSPKREGYAWESNDDFDEVDSTAEPAEAQLQTKKLPQGVKDSVEAVGPQLAMPVVTAICPAIGALATGVQLDVHGQKRGLNLIAYIAGDYASGKGQIDPVVEAWMSEVKALDKMYLMQEEEWRAKKRAAKNKKEQPEEPKLPIRCLTLNNTVANLAERLANTEGKHAFSFTPEADTVAQKWKSALSDFSIMLRQSYDGTNYEREARSADAVNVHIEKLLWNVTMCGTPDALYRVVSNYTDGFQSRMAIARTPDNTFAPLEDKPYVLTDQQTERIRQIAHLLPLMQGEIVLPKLEDKGREWVERIRVETMKNDDRTMARQRMRICVTAQRMTCCLMLCKVCEGLIQKHGLTGAEHRLKQQPDLWKELLTKAQTPQLLEAYDVIADALMENALHFFRERIENAFCSRDYAGYRYGERVIRGKNDSIYERLDVQFTFEQAMQHSVALKGVGVTRNSVNQMLKNWRKQGLVMRTESAQFRKTAGGQNGQSGQSQSGQTRI